MNVKFYAREGKIDARIQICLIHDRTHTLKVTTKHTIPKNAWDKSNQQVKEIFEGADQLNEMLLQKKLEVLKQYRTLHQQGVTEWTDLSHRLKSFIKTGKTEYHSVKSQELHMYMGEAINRFLKAREVEYKPETNRKYEVLAIVWNHFETHLKRQVSLNKLSYTDMEEFRLYLIKERKNRNDTVYKMLAALKCVLRWLIQNDYSINPKCLELGQKVKVKNEIVTLSEKELKQLQKVKLKKELKPIRDCFLFQVFTGQRYSDMQQLSPDQINNNNWEFQSVKTGKDMLVPLVGWGSTAYNVASVHQFCFPKYVPQYFNRAIKTICREAGITEMVKLKRYSGGKTITINKPKCDLISSHTARRTCVSLLLEKGVPPTVVMKLTGHSSIQTMMRYERTTNDSLIQAFTSVK
ncbi:tyrosine-type recombinase/integrase [uncultured Draconibacterium sp.]|uniref:tyrosine-type recombinase/integrase n=1 Tax=uncultured Draconibacterium sp. TaxID=1573823 RepID=UPI0025F51A09|nr:tyrosine-type recombinase/integrase [uncultured Draconibacterium sp.]